MRGVRFGATLAVVAGGALTGAPAAAQNDFGSLPEGKGQETVFYACSACHSIHLVTQQRLSRERWDKLLDWMVEEQGMAELPPEERELILNYLSTELNPDVPR